VLRGRKWGFGVPWSEHLRRVPDLRDAVAALPESAPVADGPFDRGVVHGVVHRFLAGDRTLDALVRQLLMVDVWHRTCIAGARRPPTGAPVVPVS
jgi:hypothetical protein